MKEIVIFLTSHFSWVNCIMFCIMNSNIQYFLELLLVMTEKELRARYKYTIFGFLWLAANPLIQMIIIYFIFSFFIKNPIEYYQYFLFIGLLVWNFFSLSLTKGTASIVNERSLIKKASFPKSVIPLSIILSNLVHLLIAFVLFTIPIILLGLLSQDHIIYIIFGLLLLIVFTTGLSLLTSALNVRYRDVNFFVQALLIVWFYITPIIYSIEMMPTKLIWLWCFNPMTTIIQLIQFGFLNATPPIINMFLSNLLIILFIFLLGLIVFSSESKNFDDWV